VVLLLVRPPDLEEHVRAPDPVRARGPRPGERAGQDSVGHEQRSRRAQPGAALRRREDRHAGVRPVLAERARALAPAAPAAPAEQAAWLPPLARVVRAGG